MSKNQCSYVPSFINHCLLKAILPSQYRFFTTLTHGTGPWPILRKHYFRNKKPSLFFFFLPSFLYAQFVEMDSQLGALGHHSSTINPRDYQLFQERLWFLWLREKKRKKTFKHPRTKASLLDKILHFFLFMAAYLATYLIPTTTLPINQYNPCWLSGDSVPLSPCKLYVRCCFRINLFAIRHSLCETF